jgi:hypothetical protein
MLLVLIRAQAGALLDLVRSSSAPSLTAQQQQQQRGTQ